MYGFSSGRPRLRPLIPATQVEEFLAEAAQFATDGYVDYRAFAQMMAGDDDS